MVDSKTIALYNTFVQNKQLDNVLMEHLVINIVYMFMYLKRSFIPFFIGRKPHSSNNAPPLSSL